MKLTYNQRQSLERILFKNCDDTHTGSKVNYMTKKDLVVYIRHCISQMTDLGPAMEKIREKVGNVRKLDSMSRSYHNMYRILEELKIAWANQNAEALGYVDGVDESVGFEECEDEHQVVAKGGEILVVDKKVFAVYPDHVHTAIRTHVKDTVDSNNIRFTCHKDGRVEIKRVFDGLETAVDHRSLEVFEALILHYLDTKAKESFLEIDKEYINKRIDNLLNCYGFLNESDNTGRDSEEIALDIINSAWHNPDSPDGVFEDWDEYVDYWFDRVIEAVETEIKQLDSVSRTDERAETELYYYKLADGEKFDTMIAFKHHFHMNGVI